jgi:hypothetical protein
VCEDQALNFLAAHLRWTKLVPPPIDSASTTP